MARIRRMGEEYSSGDAVITIAGMRDVDVDSINYDYKYGHTKQQGIRRKGRSWRMGPRECNCSIGLPLDVISEFEKIAPRGDIALIRPFPINIVFLNAENEMIRDLVIAKFQGNGRRVSPDEGITYEYELFVLDMDLNIM